MVPAPPTRKVRSMCFTRSTRSFALLFAALLGALAFASPARAGDLVQVTNTNTKLSWILSDLIVYGKLPGQVHVIKKPSDPSDDVEIPPGGNMIFGPAPFEIDRVFVSTKIGTSEYESFVLK